MLALGLAGCKEDGGSSGGTTEGTTSSGSDSTGTPTPEPGDPPPPRPETRHCRFDGWAPGLLPLLSFEHRFDLDRQDISAVVMQPDADVMWLGTTAGTLVRVALADGSTSTQVLPHGADSIVGLAWRGEHLFVRRAIASPSAAVQVDRYGFAADLLDADSRVRVLRVSHDAEVRVGAGLSIDPAGHLLVPFGDLAIGTDEGAARDRTQRDGSLVRLDISALASDYGYSIPADNPWADEAGVAAEAWAVGLRDPAGCSVDGQTGALWCADRGMDSSEASVVVAAADLGWPAAEGTTCRVPSGDCVALGLTSPRVAYPHDRDGCGAVGGAIARGADPLLDGAFVFGDRCSGELWGARLGQDGAADVRTIVAQLDEPPVAIGADTSGDLWLVDAQGSVGQLRAEASEGDFPTLLSESGCFDDLSTLAAAPDVVPYEINAALWSDDADKQRAIVLPPGETIEAQSDGSLVFPEGTALLKTFSVAPDDAEPDVVRPIETRVMLLRRFGWEFHSYQWNEDGTDASLLDAREHVELAVQREGVASTLPYTFPSRDACTFCHGARPSNALGPRLDQLARVTDYGTGPIDQLEALSAIGMFSDALPATTAIADPHDEQVTDEQRARGYLHANCGHCHRPGGWTPPDLTMDLRWTTPLADTALCDRVQYGSPLFDADYRVVPGDPEASLVWQRISHRGDGQMPPTGTFVVDPVTDVIRSWIEQLDGCEP